MQYGGKVVSLHDMVFKDGLLGKVMACCCEQSMLYVAVDVGELDVEISANSSRWRLSGPLDLWKAGELVQATTWHKCPDDKWMVHV